MIQVSVIEFLLAVIFSTIAVLVFIKIALFAYCEFKDGLFYSLKERIADDFPFNTTFNSSLCALIDRKIYEREVELEKLRTQKKAGKH